MRELTVHQIHAHIAEQLDRGKPTHEIIKELESAGAGASATAVVAEIAEATASRTRTDLFIADRLREGASKAEIVDAMIDLKYTESRPDAADVVGWEMLNIKRGLRREGVVATFIGVLLTGAVAGLAWGYVWSEWSFLDGYGVHFLWLGVPGVLAIAGGILRVVMSFGPGYPLWLRAKAKVIRTFHRLNQSEEIG